MNSVKRLIIIGAGPIGSILAIALANSRNKITVYEKRDIKDILKRDRVYAITHSTKTLLTRIGIWNEISAYTNYFNRLYIEDNINKSIIEFNLSDLTYKNQSSQAIGWTIDHRYLMQCLYG